MAGSSIADSAAWRTLLRRRVPPVCRSAFLAHLERNPRAALLKLAQVIAWPPPIKDFVERPEYLGLKVGAGPDADVWPAIMDILIEAVEGYQVGTRHVVPVEVVLTGAIGYGKSFIAELIEAYTLYSILSYIDPPRAFGLAESTGLVMILQSLSERLARRVLFTPLRRLVLRAPCFRQFRRNDRVVGELIFTESRVRVTPVAGHEQAAIGENVVSATLDEVNFMSIVTQSKKTRGYAEEYDTAKQNYMAISRRMRSRFLRHGHLPCKLMLVSSSRYPEDFTEVKAQEAKSDPLIYVVRRAQWDTKPRQFFSASSFRVVVGGAMDRTRILAPGDEALPTQKVIEVPEDFRRDFEHDPDGALRDLAGIPTLTVSPFIARRELLRDMQDSSIKHPFSMYETTLLDGCTILGERLHWKVPASRAVHLDLALRGDAAGVAIVYVEDVTRVERTAFEAARAETAGRSVDARETQSGRVYVEELPKFVVEAVLRVVAAPGDEVRLQQITEIILLLRNMGLPIKYVTADTYQSAAPLQALWAAGLLTGRVSCDRGPEPYEELKQAIYDRRIRCHPYERLIVELASLEKNERTGKIDHPEWTRDWSGNRVRGSKDLSDAVAGAVYTLTRRRESWWRPPVQVEWDAGKSAVVRPTGEVEFDLPLAADRA